VREFFDASTPLIAAAFLAWDGGKPIGFLELSVRQYVPGAASLPAPFVEGWFVDPEWRGRGVGRLLVKAAEDWSRSRGYRQIGSDAVVENVLGTAAHRAMGFRIVETIRCFIKELDDAT
jgi:aminoglycoside 6'-N-acetyltransferase I